MLSSIFKIFGALQRLVVGVIHIRKLILAVLREIQQFELKIWKKSDMVDVINAYSTWKN